jgi:hypothetical protein
LDGPRNHGDWEQCGRRIDTAALTHLKKQHRAFELLCNGARFGQLYSGTNHTPKIDPKEPTWASKLELALATGNNPTVFDNGGTVRRSFSPAELARMLVTFLCFAPQQLGQGYKGKSPCSRDAMLHTLLRGPNLLESVWLNLLDRETVEQTYGPGSFGKPAWVSMPASPADKAAVRNVTQTYLGRLVPMPHAILLGDDRETVEIVQNCGFAFPAWNGEPPEPTATLVVVEKKQSRSVLRARLVRAIWRDLPSLAAKRGSEGARGALAWQRFPEDRPCDFWVGALVTDGKAKVWNTLESVFSLPANASTDDFLNFYTGGVEFAQQWAYAIEKGLSAYRRALGDNIDRRQVVKRARLMRTAAASHFWTAIEAGARDVLIPLADQPPDNLKCGEPFYLDYGRGESGWGPLVRRAAEDALALACPQSSARQAAAFGAGRLAMLRSHPIARKPELPRTPVVVTSENRTL